MNGSLRAKKLLAGTTTYSDYSSYQIGPSTVAYVRGNVNKTFVAEHPGKLNGQIVLAELTEDDYYWGKVSDSTFVMAAFGRSAGIQKQMEDKEGNKLVYNQSGSVYYWYYMPDLPCAQLTAHLSQ